MNTTLNVLLAKRSELMAELARVEEAIANFADAKPVEIETHKNLRNTSGVTLLPEEADRYMMVFNDWEMTTPADKSSHGGWVLKSAIAEYKHQYPNWQEILRVLE